MWTYILRRLLLMIPTLFGVTIISFCVMQLAPGDPLEAQFSGGGMSTNSETRDAYLLRRRELKLDRPLVLNFNYFSNYQPALESTAFWLGRTEAETDRELAALAADPVDPASRAQLQFLRGLKIDKFDVLLKSPEDRPRLGQIIAGKLDLRLRDYTVYAVPDAIRLLESPQIDRQEKIGLIKCLNVLVPDPLVYTYSRQPQPEETAAVQALWGTWWQRAQKKYPPLDADDRAALQQRLDKLVDEPSAQALFDEVEYFDPDQMRFFAETLLGPKATLRQRFVAAIVLRRHVPSPVNLDLPLGAAAEQVDQVAGNWQSAYYEPHRAEYELSWPTRAWRVVADTQYAYMVARLVTFDFGHSTLKLREPVGQRVWRAVKVSAPLMFMAELVIYFIAVPVGIFCAVRRGAFDRGMTLILFLLYSIPGFIAGMVLLMTLAYGKNWFPLQGMHKEGAELLSTGAFLIDYLWHATLPVICLSLSALASMAMFSRSAMLDVIGQDYIRTARSKGLSENKVIFKHALRNALLPIITLFANFLPALLGGSVLIEYLFNIPGMGRLGFESIYLKDIPTLMALLYLDAILVMVSILLTDLLYVLVDPRISFAGQGKTA